MAPQVTSWEELLWVSEEVDEDTGDFQYTMFATVEDDVIYYGQLNQPKADILFQHTPDCLARIPDEEIFPRWPQRLTQTSSGTMAAVCDGKITGGGLGSSQAYTFRDSANSSALGE
ncbi:uncharacterized protein UV8b_00295 [Ustilaginoidea virens]|uniref:Uncharacterized protein n=1 Tax=Ustilaginoidea virens TaxID=1159556 RepID=A0A8E5HIG9_USTVR|nr:uncharacterized protein UV8b_00295 [Ustilaginoidea virens]QUC16054.1 hypothetical protein UV8b_00295 [Ustilaginoidea virens]